MNYYKQIDGLRFIAISLVLLEHFAMFIGRPLFAGFYGVDLFFVISGFLITTILIRENNSSFFRNYINFLGRRTLRIFPVYYLTLIILWLLDVDVVREYIFNLLTYTFNYAIVFYQIPPSLVNHLWSLCVEEQFYLFWPFFAIGFKNRLDTLLLITFLYISIAYLQICFNVFPSISNYNYFGLLTRMGAIGLGSFGAILCKKNMLPNNILMSKYVEFFMLIILFITLIISFKLKMLVLGICSLYLVLKASYQGFCFTSVNSFLQKDYIIYIGRISYGIYIFHLPIDYFFTKYLLDPFWNLVDFESFGIFKILKWHLWIIKFPLYSLLSFLLASYSFKYIESPLLAFKEKYFKLTSLSPLSQAIP